MISFGIKILLIALTFTVVISINESDQEHICMIQALKSIKFLDDTFPNPQQTANCDDVRSITVADLDSSLQESEDKTVSLFEKIAGANTECVARELKEKKFSKFRLQKSHALKTADVLDENEVKSYLININEVMKSILKNVSKDCNSKIEWESIFENIFGSTEASFAEKEYCFLKFARDEKIIEDLNVNPELIDFSRLDCNEIIKNGKVIAEESIREEYEDMNLSRGLINCFLDVMRENEGLEKYMVLEFIKAKDLHWFTKNRYIFKIKNAMKPDQAKNNACKDQFLYDLLN